MHNKKKLEQLRAKIKEIQEKDLKDNIIGELSEQEKKLSEQLEIYKSMKRNKGVEFVYLESAKGSITSPLAMYKRINEYGEYFNREKIYIDRIGEVEIDISKIELLGFKKYLEKEEDIKLSKCMFIDIETTGLESGSGTIAYIIGLGFFDNASFVVRQFFLRDFDEEHALLSAVNEYAGKFEYVFTYNGKRFDINILQNRYTLNRIPFKLSELTHIDIYTILRSLYLNNRGGLSLSTVEKELIGIERLDDIASYLIPDIYYQYLKRGYSELLEYVFEHNAQDVVSLAGLALYLDKAFLMDECNEKLMGAIYYHYGKCAAERGDYKEAIRCYEEAIKYNLNKKTIRIIIKDLCKFYKVEGEEHKVFELVRDIYDRMPDVISYAYLKKLALYYENKERDLMAAFYYAAKCSECFDEIKEDEGYIKRIFKKMMKSINK
jgi:uncharacterized protein YprB with RNaseH-like and TPR domain